MPCCRNSFDSFTVSQLECRGCLNRMTDGVPEIQHHSLAGNLLFVLLHNPGFNLATLRHERAQDALFAFEHRVQVGLKQFKHAAIAYHPVFDNFGKAGTHLGRFQGVEQRHIG